MNEAIEGAAAEEEQKEPAESDVYVGKHVAPGRTEKGSLGQHVASDDDDSALNEPRGVADADESGRDSVVENGNRETTDADTASNDGTDVTDGDEEDSVPRGKHAAVALPAVNGELAVETVVGSSDETTGALFESVDEADLMSDDAADENAEAYDESEILNNDSDEDAVAGSDTEGGESDDGEEAGGFVAAFNPLPKHRAGKALRVFGITLGVIAGVVLAVYLAGVAVFSNIVPPQTTIGSLDLSLKPNEEAQQIIDTTVSSYKIDVLGAGGFTYRTDAQELGLTVDSKQIVNGIHKDLNPWMWPLVIYEGAHDESELLVGAYNNLEMSHQLGEKLAAYNETAADPQDAKVGYDENAKKFVVIPEVQGAKYQPQLVYNAVDVAIKSFSPKVQLSTEQLVPPKILQTDERLVNAAQKANAMVSANIALKMPGGADAGSVNSENLSPLVTIDENFEVILDEDELVDWIDDYVDDYNTIGSERTYTRPDGKVITVSGGAYGWEIDNEALATEIIDAVKSGSTTEITIPCYSEAQVYNGAGKPDWGKRYIDVDLSEQHVYFYDEDGDLIWESDCISGTPDGRHDTVPGVWYITNKESPSKLVGYEGDKKEYETWVTYWMPFEGNSIGMHDATWQPGFGGSMYASGYGSHGCVNLPYYAAEELYYLCEVEDVVIAHW